MASTNDLYPIDCPFCKIAQAYPAEASPIPHSPDPDLISPQAHVILSTPHVMAFLDILPMAPGHILVTTRDHYQKVSDLYNPKVGADWVSQQIASKSRQDSRAIGEWLPLVSRALCKVTGIEDWNIVQNNGERAAQVVPHVHFHLIPRYQEGRRPTASKGNVDFDQMKSWRMFGRGTREELDDDEAKEMSANLRAALREEVREEQNERAKLWKATTILCAHITEDLASLLSGLDVELLSSILQVFGIHARVCIKVNDARFKEAMWIMTSLVSLILGLTKSSRARSAVADVQTGFNTDFPNLLRDHNLADAFMSQPPSQDGQSADAYGPSVNYYNGSGPSSDMQRLEKPFEQFPGFGWLDSTAADV
ncbi:hypothetical protein MBLNU13_g09271t2 [Cladosporium sp. NU13]